MDRPITLDLSLSRLSFPTLNRLPTPSRSDHPTLVDGVPGLTLFPLLLPLDPDLCASPLLLTNVMLNLHGRDPRTVVLLSLLTTLKLLMLKADGELFLTYPTRTVASLIKLTPEVDSRTAESL